MPFSYLVFLLSLLWSVTIAHQNAQAPLTSEGQRPNILFVLTDDQDLHMDSLSYMPYLKKHITDRGTSFNRHYCTVALCCPSRVSMWTGKAAHNTNVTDINPPYGGYPKFISQGFNDHYLPVWLQAAGYSTYYVGKLFNAQTVRNYNSPHAAGWTGSEFLLDPFTYRYLNATFQRNHDEPVSYEGQYSTDVVSEKSHGFLEDALNGLKEHGNPFFLTVAPIAPHSDVNIKHTVIDGNFSENTNVQSPPVPAERHKHLFEDVVVPRTPNFNPDIPGGASWISRLPQQNQTNIAFNDHFYRNRLRSLQAVDDMIDSLMSRLGEAGILNNTYVFYSSDNGYSIGQHRRQPGKQCAFEEDINVPLIVRGPGIAAGEHTDIVTSHTDLAPTFLSLAGALPPTKFELDGQVIPLKATELLATMDSEAEPTQEHVNVEMWGIIMSEGNYGSVLYPNHTYKALRVVGTTYSFLYTVWCSNEHELYDMNADPYQLHNLYGSDSSADFTFNRARSELLDFNYSTPNLDQMSSSTFSQPVSHSRQIDGRLRRTVKVRDLTRRLDALLMVLKSCEGRYCTHPWEALFPTGQVKTLADAIDPTFNDFFDNAITPIEFQQCEKGYIVESEGPMWDQSQAYGMVDEMAFE